MVDASEFYQLTLDKIPVILQEIQDSFTEHCQNVNDLPGEIRFVRTDRDKLECVPLGFSDGLANYIYRLSSGHQSVVVKWATLTYKIEEIHDIGLPKQDAAVTVRRNEHDYQGIRAINRYVQQPRVMPRVYWLDTQRHFFLMEYLADHVTMKEQLAEGVVRRQVFLDVASFLGTLHRRTHRNTLPQGEFQQLLHDFNVKFADYHQSLFTWFTGAAMFRSDSPNAQHRLARRISPELRAALGELIDSPRVREAMQEVRHSLLNINHCLIHNDSHPGFVMVSTRDNTVKFIDCDLTMVGNPAKEIGYLMGELVIWYYVNLGRGRRDAASQIVQYASELVEKYMAMMGELIEDTQTFYYYMSLHAGHFNGFRTANIMPFPQFAGLDVAEAQCVHVAATLLKHTRGQIATFEQFVDTAFLPYAGDNTPTSE